MGILFGLISALGSSFQNTFFKSEGLKAENPFLLNWYRLLGGLPVMALLVTLFAEWKIPEPRFWLILLGLSLPVELALSYLYVRAFQSSPQSLVGPLFSLSALFLIPLGYVFLGELPSTLGAIGILSVMIGPFFLGKESQGKFGSMKNLLREKGTWYMLASAFLAASGVTITKFSFQYASPLLFTFYSLVLLLLAITIILWFQRGFSHLFEYCV
ncbi:MAG: drug/metabolite transporter (DMT) superfamily permease [Parcubacteria group bacterium Gr01-1014_33]|nr:MAG: drug/metabolite transporter (DMT) superfamily permease [Parcubacteria group bacterium Gr01-1014_33]